jgi:Tol biopolymer transport system component
VDHAPPRRTPRLWTALALVLAVFVAATPALSLAAARKLNGQLALGGRIAELERFDFALNRALFPGYQVSADNSTVVFLADQSTAGVFELYSAPVGGGSAPVKLNGALAPGGNVVEFAIDSSSQRVVYLADQRVDETFELFSAPIGGGSAPLPLNSFLTAEGDVSNFLLSPDGSTAIFRADRNDDEVFDLFTAPVGGGAPDVRLNDRTGLTGDVQPDFAISPDNQRVIFRFDAQQEGTFGIFSAPLTGGGSSDIGSGAGAPNFRSALDFVIAPDSQRVVYRGRNLATGNSNLFLTPVAGPVIVFFALTGFGAGSSVEGPSGADVPADDTLFPAELPYAFTPDSADVVFIADATDGLYQLHRVTATPGPGPVPAPTLLSTNVSGVRDVTNFRISPDSSRVVYRADDADNRFELSSVPRDLSSNATFLLPSPPVSNGDIFEFAITPDGSRVVYRGDFIVDERFELRSSPIDRSTNTVLLNGALAPGGDVARFAVTANGQRVLYSADQDLDGVSELYSVLATGGTATRVNSSLVNGGDVEDFVLSPNGQRAVFRADTATDEVFNLVSVPSAGPAASGVTLTDTESISGDTGAFALSPDGAYAVFVADEETDEQFELYSAALGGGPPAHLNTTLRAGGTINEFHVSPDGSRVVYAASQADPAVVDLYSVPSSGGAAVRLSSLVPGRELSGQGFAISPNGQRVVYLADQTSDDDVELYSIAIGGGSPATLNNALPPGGDITSFAISADSSRVVYVGDQNSDEVFEIYSVPLNDGSIVRLNPPLQSGRDVLGDFSCLGQRSQWDALSPSGVAPFLISPNSQRVVYCADQDADDIVELYSAPIATGSAATKLNIPPGAGGGISSFEISPDSSRVVFESSTLVAGAPQDQLYSAPLGGGSQPTLLNGPVPALSFVGQFAITPDSGAVAFTSDRGTGGQIELYATPISSGAISKRSGALVAGGSVFSFQISQDSSRLVYLADQLSDNDIELFVTQVSGDDVAFVVSDPLVANGDLLDFRLRSGNDGIVYQADQLIDEVAELFEAPFASVNPGQVRVAFLDNASTREGAGTLTLTVSLDRVSNTPVTVSYAVSGGTATGGGVDYVLAPGTLTFPAGQTQRTITVGIVDDSVAESAETIIVTLSSPTGGASLGTRSSATVTIRDNEGNEIFLPLLRR